MNCYGRRYDGSGVVALANDWVRHFALAYGMINNGVPRMSPVRNSLSADKRLRFRSQYREGRPLAFLLLQSEVRNHGACIHPEFRS